MRVAGGKIAIKSRTALYFEEFYYLRTLICVKKSVRLKIDCTLLAASLRVACARQRGPARSNYIMRVLKVGVIAYILHDLDFGN